MTVVPISPFPHEVESSGVFVVDDPDEDESVRAQLWHRQFFDADIWKLLICDCNLIYEKAVKVDKKKTN